MKRVDVEEVLSLANEAGKGLESAERIVWIEKLTQASARIRSALRWLLRSGEVESGLELLGNLYWFLAEDDARRHEGHDWYRTFLARLGTLPTPTRARALDRAAGLALNDGDYSEASQLAEQVLAIRRDIGDLSGVGYSLCHLGHIAQEMGDADRAWRLPYEALAIFRGLDDEPGIAAAVGLLGELALDRHDAVTAAPLVRESLKLGWSLKQDVLYPFYLDLAASYALIIRQARLALRLAGAADAERRRLGLVPELVTEDTPANRFRLKWGRRWDTILDDIDENERAALWAEGHDLAVADAFAVALEIVAPEPPRP